MRREERRRKFHEALLNTLYPQSSQTQQEDIEDEHVSPSIDGINVHLIPDDYGLLLEQSDDEDNADDEEKKLSRSQRKRLRQKKIKEDIARRSNIIGPLLPPDVRQNACFDDISVFQEEEEASGGSDKHNKMKQRRTAKKRARDKLKSSSNVDCSVQDHLLKSSTDKLETCQDQCIESSNNLETCDEDRNMKFEDCPKDTQLPGNSADDASAKLRKTSLKQ